MPQINTYTTNESYDVLTCENTSFYSDIIANIAKYR